MGEQREPATDKKRDWSHLADIWQVIGGSTAIFLALLGFIITIWLVAWPEGWLTLTLVAFGLLVVYAFGLLLWFKGGNWRKIVNWLKIPVPAIFVILVLVFAWLKGWFALTWKWSLGSLTLTCLGVIGLCLLGLLWNRRRVLAEQNAQLQGAQIELERANKEAAQWREKLDWQIKRFDDARSKVGTLNAMLEPLLNKVGLLGDESKLMPDHMEVPRSAWERACEILDTTYSNHVARIVYYDSGYRDSWVRDSEAVRDYFVQRGFIEKNAKQLGNWMRMVNANGTACRSVVVFAKDVVPDTVAEVMNDTCTIRRYLNAGGRVVWQGDIPFWYQGRPGQSWEKWHNRQTNGPWEILGVLYTHFQVVDSQGRGRPWDSAFPTEVTQAGVAIGLVLVNVGAARRPVPCEQVTTVFVRIGPVLEKMQPEGIAQKYFAYCWKKNFNAQYSHSGFMQYLLGECDGADEKRMAEFFRFAVSGWPLVFE